MKKRITVLLAALMLALSMSFGGVAFASGGHSFHGCKHGSQGKKASHGKCHHHNGGHHNGGGNNGGDDDDDDD
jgi:hypothetical protein